MKMTTTTMDVPTAAKSRVCDGVVQSGIEECDDGDQDNNNGCTGRAYSLLWRWLSPSRSRGLYDGNDDDRMTA